MGKMEGGTLTLGPYVQVNLIDLFLLILHNMSVLTPYIQTTPGQNLYTAAVAITAIVCLIIGTVCGVLLTVCISRWKKKERISKPAPNTQEQQQTAVVYEEVDTQSKK